MLKFELAVITSAVLHERTRRGLAALGFILQLLLGEKSCYSPAGTLPDIQYSTRPDALQPNMTLLAHSYRYRNSVGRAATASAFMAFQKVASPPQRMGSLQMSRFM